MVQKTVVINIDDFSGKESEEVSTHAFSLDGVSYEIDLVPENYDKLYDALAPFIENGRKTGRAKGAKARKDTDGPSAEEVRVWARDNGLQVNERGRVPKEIREAFEAAH